MGQGDVLAQANRVKKHHDELNADSACAVLGAQIEES